MNIYIEKLTKRYGNKNALIDANLMLLQGSFTAIVGPSGCGKTTLLRSLAGFLTTDEGRIKFGDLDVTNLPPQKRQTAMVFQNYALWPHMTVYENIAYGLKLRKYTKKEIEEKVYMLLEKVEIDASDVKKRFPREYSGGQQQRIALARALVLEPKLLLMDEPLSNLDAKVRQRLRIEIRRLQKELGITAVYVTHDQEEAFSMADQVVIMNNGRIEQVGTPKTLYENPQSYFVADFLGNSNTLRIKNNQGNYFLDSQRLEGLEVNNYNDSEELNLVVRSEDIKVSIEKNNSKEWISLKGRVKESLFIGSNYRTWVEIEKQNLFIISDTKITGINECYVNLPKNKCFMFPKTKAKNLLV